MVLGKCAPMQAKSKRRNQKSNSAFVEQLLVVLESMSQVHRAVSDSLNAPERFDVPASLLPERPKQPERILGQGYALGNPSQSKGIDIELLRVPLVLSVRLLSYDE
jgi:hypothetical protein